MDKNDNNISWLLEEENPSLRLRTLKEILNKNDADPEVIRLKTELPQSIPILGILNKMHPDGYWLQKNSRHNGWVGDGVEYGSFGTTHFCLAYLAELAMDRAHPSIEKAAERYLSLQKSDGDWWNHYSCLYGYNIRTLILLGYRNDSRLQRSIDLMLAGNKPDGGYLCEMHEGKYKKRTVKSCIRGSVKTLMAFAELPEYWDHPRCKRLVAYFLGRAGIFRSNDPTQFVNHDMDTISFPIIWKANAWEILYSLSKMGYGKDERLSKAWELLNKKANEENRYYLDWTPGQCSWNVGKRGEENKWITFYVTLAEKFRKEVKEIDI